MNDFEIMGRMTILIFDKIKRSRFVISSWKQHIIYVKMLRLKIFNFEYFILFFLFTEVSSYLLVIVEMPHRIWYL